MADEAKAVVDLLRTMNLTIREAENVCACRQGGDKMLKWLVELRGNRTQDALAKEIGIPQSTYASIEVGIRRPSVAMAKKIAEAMGFSWTRFFE